MLESTVEEPGGGPAAPGRRRPGAAVAWIAAGVVLAAGAGLLAAVVVPWPAVATLARENPSTTAFIERHRAQELRAGRSGRVLWIWVPYGSISSHLKRAVLVAEDIDFFSHQGFSTTELGQALRQAWAEKRVPRGASTVTQQLAKNLWLSPSRHPLRKAREAVLTWRLERALGKRRILELYLNVAEFGPGVYGAEAAARHHFGKPAAALGEREAAQLAALLPRPGHWRPDSDSQTYQRRVASIERRMAKAGWLWRAI